MNTLNIQEIIQLLPHSYPFLMVDRVTALQLNESISGIKNVTANEPYFMGHFPNKPIMPGVMIIEALAQISGILAKQSYADCKERIFYLAAINSAKFKRIVTPGDTLLLDAQIIKQRRSMWKFETKAVVDGSLACSAEIMIAEE